MQTRNVHYSERPDDVMIVANGPMAVIELPVNVTEVEVDEERTEYVAEYVYSVKTVNTPDLKKRVEENYEAWLEVAMQVEPQKPSIEDVVDAINVLTDLILGGE